MGSAGSSCHDHLSYGAGFCKYDSGQKVSRNSLEIFETLSRIMNSLVIVSSLMK